MNGRPHSFSFGPRPATSVTSFPSTLASPPPLSRLILDCSRPPLRPLLLRHPHYYSLSGASLSISPHRTFSSSPFFLGTRRRLPFVLVSHPLFHGRALRTKRARVALRSPREHINDECFTLSPEVGPFAFARALSVLPLSTMFSAHSALLFSLPSLLPASQFFHRRFPFPVVFRSYLNGVRPVSLAIPNLV